MSMVDQGTAYRTGFQLRHTSTFIYSQCVFGKRGRKAKSELRTSHSTHSSSSFSEYWIFHTLLITLSSISHFSAPRELFLPRKVIKQGMKCVWKGLRVLQSSYGKKSTSKCINDLLKCSKFHFTCYCTSIMLLLSKNVYGKYRSQWYLKPVTKEPLWLLEFIPSRSGCTGFHSFN